MREIQIHHISQIPPSGSRAVPCERTNGQTEKQRDRQIHRGTDRYTEGQTDTQRDRQIHRGTDMTKLRVAFRNFEKVIRKEKERPENKEVNKEKEINVD